jgi:hypothetical protein
MPALQFPDPPLQDDVVLLRPWDTHDVPIRARAFSEPVLQRFSLPTAMEVTDEDVRR